MCFVEPRRQLKILKKFNNNNYKIVRHIVFMGESTSDFKMNLFQLLKLVLFLIKNGLTI